MLFTIGELFDIVLMSLVIGFIFKDVFAIRPKPEDYDPLKQYSVTKKSMFNDDFWFAVMVTAPAVILHEFAHKFIAMSFGMQAVFSAAYLWLLIGVVLKLMRFSFIFFVPAYVSIFGTGTSLEFSLIALAGPAINCILWVCSYLILKFGLVRRKYYPFLHLTSKINMFLFIFNMLPIPGFDGGKVFAGLISMF